MSKSAEQRNPGEYSTNLSSAFWTQKSCSQCQCGNAKEQVVGLSAQGT